MAHDQEVDPRFPIPIPFCASGGAFKLGDFGAHPVNVLEKSEVFGSDKGDFRTRTRLGALGDRLVGGLLVAPDDVYAQLERFVVCFTVH